MQVLTVLFLLMLALSCITQLWLARRQLHSVSSHRAQVPNVFAEKISLTEHQKAADYTLTKTRFAQVTIFVEVALLLLWTLGGLLDTVDQAWRALEWSPLWTGVAVILSIMLLASLIDLPFSWYRTFKIESRFGFNRMDLKLFLSDNAKMFALTLALGVPLIALVLWLMESAGDLWWLWVWAVWMGFNLLMMWAYPSFIAPLFNKFKPLEDDELRQRIERLLSRNGFASQGIFVADGSRRSGHGNAYFAGLGRNKRIVFFDTLLDGLNVDEVEAVLAHELGHFRRHHLHKRVVLMAGFSLVGLALLGWLMQQAWFFQQLGVSMPSTYMALTLFVMVMPVFTFFLSPAFAWVSRKHEFEADSFAAEQAKASALVQALVKLYKENANTLTPDPLYSAFYDSHPPAPVRIAHLSS